MTSGPPPPRLTSLSPGAGCGCKLPAAWLAEVLDGIGAGARAPVHPVLVGFRGADDAGVVALREDLALVHTADFFTPVVDDPYDFGRIAAANALSDVYAMGADPVSALNLVAFPHAAPGLPPEVLRRILEGGSATCAEAGVPIVGGHSIDDPVPKYGLAVAGTVAPAELLTNAGGRPADVLVLTKPLGTGIVTTALRRGLAGAEPALVPAVAAMAGLNGAAAAAARAAGARALTDVTGFGLTGHLHELARASGCAAELDADAVPALPGVDALLASAGEAVISGGTRRNRAAAEAVWEVAAAVPGARRWLLCDATTSGGLLAAVPAGGVQAIPGAVIGRLVAGPRGRITVRAG